MGEERGLFLTLLSPPPPFSLLSVPFPPKTLDTQASASVAERRGERDNICYYFCLPSPHHISCKEARNRWLSLHAYMLYPKPGIVNSLLSLLVHYSELIFVKAK